MKNAIGALLFVFPTLMGAPCDQNRHSLLDGNGNAITENTECMSDTLIIKIGYRKFTATLDDNATANAFKEMLPLTMNMTELNGNEKYFDLSKSLPKNASNPGQINAGDLLLYGSNTLVLFYKSFSTSYSYTRLGQIDDATDLAETLGSGKLVVTMELK
jgi:hypothetical protein